MYVENLKNNDNTIIILVNIDEAGVCQISLK